jgi:hypothetical protein
MSALSFIHREGCKSLSELWANIMSFGESIINSKLICNLLWGIFILCLISCHDSSPQYSLNPENRVIQELQNHRIIMLGDYGHEKAAPFQGLIKILNQWVDEHAQRSTACNHLLLFLEADDNIINLVHNYLISGNDSALLRFMLPNCSLERLEFYYDLKRLLRRVDSINGILPNSNKIQLIIEAGEPEGNYTPRMLQMSSKETDNYFVKVRDSLIAEKIGAFLIKHNDSKALIFYGQLHLIKNYVQKIPSDKLFPSEVEGYYLAYYLKNMFGQDSILSINQIAPGREKYLNSNLGEIADKSVFLWSDELPWHDFQPDNFDAFILRGESFTPEHPARLIFSRKVVESSLNWLRMCNQYLPGKFAQMFCDRSIKTLQTLTGLDYVTLEDWEKWYKQNSFDGYSRLNSLNFQKQIKSSYFNSNDDVKRYELLTLGFNINVLNAHPNGSSEDWTSLWQTTYPQIKFINSIGIYWFGYSDEKEKAKSFLIEFSGENFKDPDQYLKWWRQRYYNTNY